MCGGKEERGEDAESWDVGNSLIGLIIRGVMLYYTLVGFIKFIDERKMMRVNNASLTKLEVVNSSLQTCVIGIERPRDYISTSHLHSLYFQRHGEQNGAIAKMCYHVVLCLKRIVIPVLMSITFT